MRSRLGLVGLIAAISSFGCSGKEDPGSSAGGASTGGSGASGATSGGSPGLGGASSGGNSGAAGAATGASTSSGGSSSAGGSSAGGNPTTGGTVSNGGSPAAGGTVSNGGSSGASGATSTGGAMSTGGANATGGSSTGTSGGTTTGSGGATTGGSAGSSGNGSGGAKSTGGSTGTGGSAGGSTAGVVGEPVGFATQNGGTVGGKGGQVVTVTTFADLKKYATASGAYVILINGTISNGAAGGAVSITSNKSLVGIGSTAFLQGVGLEVKNSNNVIIQNLKITLVGTTTPSSVNGGDGIAINGTSKNVWIDHCELYSEDPTVQTNIDKYDGLIDIRDQTGWITVSWSYLHDHHKTSLVGAADTDIYADRKITYHHNYFKQVVKRAPAEYRGAVGHFFNNYIVGTGITEASFLLVNTCVRIEKSVYENVKYAVYTESSGTKGNAELIDNVATQSRAFPPACTASIPYEYKNALTANTADVKTLVPAGAGVGKL